MHRHTDTQTNHPCPIYRYGQKYIYAQFFLPLTKQSELALLACSVLFRINNICLCLVESKPIKLVRSCTNNFNYEVSECSLDLHY